MLDVEDLAVLNGYHLAQGFDIGDRFVAAKLDILETVTVAFDDRHGNVHHLAPGLHDQGNVKASGADVADLGLRVVNGSLEVAALLVGVADHFHVFAELGGVVGAREKVFQEDGVGDADGPRVAHGVAQRARLHVLVVLELDAAHLHLGAFLNHEGDGNGSRRNLPNLGADGGELAAVLGQQVLDHNLGALDAGWIVLAFLGKRDLAFLESVQHVGLRNRVQAEVLDLADGRLFLDVNVDDPALGCLLALEADVFEIAGVPQGVEAALDHRGVVNLAAVDEHTGFNGLCGNPALAVSNDVDDEVLLGPGAQ